VRDSRVQSPKRDVRYEYGDLAGPSARRLLRPAPAGLAEGNWISVMMRARGVTGVATAALVVVALGACSNDGNDPAASPSASQSTSSSPAPTTPTPPSEGEIASEAASDVVRAYFATVDQVRQDAKRPEIDLDAVASSTQLTAQKRLLKNQRESGRRQVGDTKVIEVSVESVSLDDPATAYIDVCWDVTEVDILDADGKSVVTDGRKDVGWTRFVVTNPAWETAPTDGWRVSSGSDLEKEPCAAS